ncbi:lipid-A-disaccharide synthase [Phorcysia thermohydrogeniphila]|uniref:Lipid-A-disaccharide synthase n=1 Tax=Phorcysia thermohydrogeniphila TaxID=936138 RepID=A0A4V2PDB4_9BACT|nr:lipid-A-disaccharide synthase [Phorcysia thermohydrogeniphila]TCK04496.1 lipid-A-disaccharide synthase [Phorcysia thermohydrogeniphila]
MKKILIVTGELSGFNYAKELVPLLSSHLKVFGVFLEEVEGAERILDSKELLSFGLFEAIKNLSSILRGKRRIVSFLERERPDAVLLVDFPGFNLKIAEVAKEKGIKVLYFISPKFWAWGEWRVKKIKRLVDRMFVIFPFEVELYRRYGVNVTYVGNPLKEMVKPTIPPDEFLKKFGLSRPLFALFPGSRPSEVNSLLEPMLLAVKGVEGSFALPVASSVNFDEIEERVRRIHPKVRLIPESERYNLLFSADAGIIASGTASLEASLAELPHVVVYKLHPLTFKLAKRLVKIPFVSLPNIIAGQRVVPELLQDDVTPEKIKEELLKVLDRKEEVKKLLREKVNSKLKGGAIRRLAEEIKLELGVI